MELTDRESPLPTIVDRAAFEAEIDALRVLEKAHIREGDALAAARRRLPMVEMDSTLQLVGPNGPLTLLEAFEGHFAAPQSATEQHGQEGAVANAFDGRGVGSIQQTLRLGVGEPVPSALAVLGDTFDAADASTCAMSSKPSSPASSASARARQSDAG